MKTCLSLLVATVVLQESLAFVPSTIQSVSQQHRLEDSALFLTTSDDESRRRLLLQGSAAALALLASSPAHARLESVDRPDLLPKESGLNVIQTEKFLTTGQAKRLNELLTSLEKDTGYRLRVLCQAYPNTPGLAIRDVSGRADSVCRECLLRPDRTHRSSRSTGTSERKAKRMTSTLCWWSISLVAAETS